jgi:hypothetical protein
VIGGKIKEYNKREVIKRKLGYRVVEKDIVEEGVS